MCSPAASWLSAHQTKKHVASMCSQCVLGHGVLAAHFSTPACCANRMRAAAFMTSPALLVSAAAIAGKAIFKSALLVTRHQIPSTLCSRMMPQIHGEAAYSWSSCCNLHSCNASSSQEPGNGEQQAAQLLLAVALFASVFGRVLSADSVVGCGSSIGS